jgi:hypothetical protein
MGLSKNRVSQTPLVYHDFPKIEVAILSVDIGSSEWNRGCGKPNATNHSIHQH